MAFMELNNTKCVRVSQGLVTIQVCRSYYLGSQLVLYAYSVMRSNIWYKECPVWFKDVLTGKENMITLMQNVNLENQNMLAKGLCRE